jgi:hypothetical protein
MGLFDLAEVDIAAHSGFPEKFSRSVIHSDGTPLTIEIPHQPVQAVGVRFIDGIH